MSFDERKMWENKIKGFWSSLTEDQKSDLWSLWDNGILIDEDFEEFIDQEWYYDED